MGFITLENINKTFYGVKALNNINLTINHGEVLCLAGQNGCGKSTLIKIISGVYTPDAGAKININGQNFNKLTPKQSIKEGVQVIYQDLSLFPNLSVVENITINLYHTHLFVLKKTAREMALTALEKINADIDLDEIVENLSIAQQQLVAISRAIAQDAKLIIMDEPTASLTMQEIEALLDIVMMLKKSGISIIFVSHKLDEVLKVSDSIVVLKDGNLVGKYPIDEIDIKKLAYLMTGLNIEQQQFTEPCQNEEVLRIEHLSKDKKFNDISFNLRKGEIISIIGLLGSGRTDLCLSLFGISKPTSGKIYLEGKEITFKNNREAIDAGIGYVSEDRMNLGLIMDMPIADNIISTILNKIKSKLGILDSAQRMSISDNMIENLKIKVSDKELPVNTLSGGNAQRISIAKWIVTNPKVLILDEPTIGVDIANKAGIFALIKELASLGISIIFVTDEIDEAFFNSHRVFVMNHGSITHEFNTTNITQKDIEEALNVKE